MALALSEILVVSEASTALGSQTEMVAAYHDLLVRNALGNYRELLEQVTLSQAMGYYLSMFQNQKPDPANGIRSDENYAREIMQLFTVGLDQLNPDGSVKLDGMGQTLPTYGQADIANLARVFTGWGNPGGTDDSGFFFVPDAAPERPMQAYETFHDRDAKTIIGGVQIPAGLNAQEDLDRALDTLFAHPNVGPFIGRQLIQRLVTSNPSPAYVQRVAAVFNDNGNGERGDLYAVARAILMDLEARNGHVSNPVAFGKLREPLIRMAHLWRAFSATSRSRRYGYPYPEEDLAQAPLRSPSVFNFFRPHYQPAGPLAEAGLVAPEFQIVNENTITSTGNALDFYARGYLTTTGLSARFFGDEDVYLDYRSWEERARNLPGLVDDLDLIFLSGQMSDAMRQTLLDHLELVPPSEPAARVSEAVNLIVGSAQYALQR